MRSSYKQFRDKEAMRDGFWITDGTVGYVEVKKRKDFRDGEFVHFFKEMVSREIKPATLIHYYCDAEDMQAVSPDPIPGADTHQPPLAVYQTPDQKKFFYNQYKLNCIPDTRFLDPYISDQGMLFFSINGQALGVIAPMGMKEPDIERYENTVKDLTRNLQ